MRILVTGATGYIGGRLAPRMLEAGHEVRCLARTPDKLRGVPWAADVEVARGDVTDAESLKAACQGVDVVYYLVHSLSAHGFAEVDRRAAEVTAKAAREAGVRRIVYLGGLVPPTSAALQDPRVEVVVGDVRHVLAAQPPGSLDLVLLDVDNGPGYLVYEDIAAVYEDAFLQTCHAALTTGGVLAVWSAAEAPALESEMREIFHRVDELTVPVTLGKRETTYHVLAGHR